MLRIGTNISALKAQNRLAQISEQRSRTFERLASGLRINRASDDAAGLAISSSLNSDARVFNQAIRNVNDGISVLNISAGALKELTNITIRQRELAIQAANGTYSVVQRRVLNQEVTALTNEFNRIVASVEFNGTSLLDGRLDGIRIQAGYGIDGSINFDIGEELARTAGNGTFGTSVSFVTAAGTGEVQFGDFNKDGIIDLAVANGSGDNVSYLRGNGDGTFLAPVNYAVGNGALASTMADFDNDGNLDIAATNFLGATVGVLMGRGDGTFDPVTSFVSGNVPGLLRNADFNGDGIEDLVATNLIAGTLSVLIGNGDGTFKARTSFVAGSRSAGIAIGDFNGDGILDLATADYQEDRLHVLFGDGTGNFGSRQSFAIGSSSRKISTGDFNRDGFLDMIVSDQTDETISVLIGNGDGSFKNRVTYAGGNLDVGEALTIDVNGDGLLDVVTTDLSTNSVSIFIGNGDGTLQARQTFSSFTSTVAAGDINGDGVADLVTSNYAGNTVGVLLANTEEKTSIAHLNITTVEGARAALGELENTLNRISSEMGALGSFQSRLEVSVNVLEVARENFLAAESRITNVDVAQEAAELVRTQILQNVSATILAQANQEPALAIRLLQ